MVIQSNFVSKKVQIPYPLNLRLMRIVLNKKIYSYANLAGPTSSHKNETFKNLMRTPVTEQQSSANKNIFRHNSKLNISQKMVSEVYYYSHTNWH